MGPDGHRRQGDPIKPGRPPPQHLRTIAALPKQTQKKCAPKTLEIFAPLLTASDPTRSVGARGPLLLLSRSTPRKYDEIKDSFAQQRNRARPRRGSRRIPGQGTVRMSHRGRDLMLAPTTSFVYRKYPQGLSYNDIFDLEPRDARPGQFREGTANGRYRPIVHSPVKPLAGTSSGLSWQCPATA